MPQFDLKKATVKFRDGTNPTPLELTLKVAEGTLNYTERKNRKYTKDRGELDSVMDGDEEPMDVRMDLIYEFSTASSGSDATPEDVLKNEGEASAWVSSDTGDACNPYAVDILIDYAPDCGAIEDQLTVLQYFRYEQLDFNLKDGMLSVSGKCNVTKANHTRS